MITIAHWLSGYEQLMNNGTLLKIRSGIFAFVAISVIVTVTGCSWIKPCGKEPKLFYPVEIEKWYINLITESLPLAHKRYPEHFIGIGISSDETTITASILAKKVALADMAQEIRLYLEGFTRYLRKSIQWKDSTILIEEFEQIIETYTVENLKNVGYFRLDLKKDNTGKTWVAVLAKLYYKDYYDDVRRKTEDYDAEIQEFKRTIKKLTEQEEFMKTDDRKKLLRNR